MENECYFCHGIVSLYEKNDILLDGHGDHQVFMHKRCAAGYDLIEKPDDSTAGPIKVTCPKCGTIESL